MAGSWSFLLSHGLVGDGRAVSAAACVYIARFPGKGAQLLQNHEKRAQRVHVLVGGST